jgi:hypothetical protein
MTMPSATDNLEWRPPAQGGTGLPTTQRQAFVRAIGRWAVEARTDAAPLLLFVFTALGHPEGNRPIDIETAHHPNQVVTLDGLRERLDQLIDQVGLGEDFLVTGLVRAIEEHLARMAESRDEALTTFRALRMRMDAVAADPATQAAFMAEHGLGEPDLPAMRAQVDLEIGRLEDPGWAQAQRGLLEAWRRASHGLLRPDRRAAWEAERFEQAAKKLDFFFKGPAGAVMQPLPPGYEREGPPAG